MPRLVRSPAEYLAWLAETYGDFVHLRFGDRNFYVVSDGDTIRDVLTTQAAQFEKFPRIDAALGLFGEGLLTSEEPEHMRQRRMLQPAFHHQQVLGYSEQILQCTRELLDTWSDGQVLDMAVEMNRLTLEIICRTMFGSSAAVYAREVGHLLETILPMLNRLVLPFGTLRLSLPLPSTRAYFRALRRLDEILESMVETGDSGLLSMLLAARDEQGRPLSAKELRDQVITIFVAGHETTGNGLAWILYLAAQQPQVWARLRDEASPGIDFERLPYARAVAQEGWRLYPPVWIMGRRALQDVRVGELDVPRNTVVLISQFALHRRSATFERSQEFRPERWLEQAPPRWGYLPFGAGPRVCIGERFALYETVLILASLAERFNIEPRFGRVRPGAYLTLRPKPGVPVRVVNPNRCPPQ